MGMTKKPKETIGLTDILNQAFLSLSSPGSENTGQVSSASCCFLCRQHLKLAALLPSRAGIQISDCPCLRQSQCFLDKTVLSEFYCLRARATAPAFIAIQTF